MERCFFLYGKILRPSSLCGSLIKGHSLETTLPSLFLKIVLPFGVEYLKPIELLLSFLGLLKSKFCPSCLQEFHFQVSTSLDYEDPSEILGLRKIMSVNVPIGMKCSTPKPHPTTQKKKQRKEKSGLSYFFIFTWFSIIPNNLKFFL